MKRKALYSRAARPRPLPERRTPNADLAPDDWFQIEQPPGAFARGWAWTKAFIHRHDRAAPAAAAAALVLLIVFGWLGIVMGPQLLHPMAPPLDQWDIDNAVKYTMANTPPGLAETSVAAAMIAPSVVRVDGYLSPEHAAEIAKQEALEAKKAGKKPDKPDPKDKKDGKKDDKSAASPDNKPHPDSTGSGVVITEQGDILTNLHVIRSTDRWEITFFDGSKSDAILVSTQPENDLAVIRAKHQPDDLKPATLASTRDLFPGDMVVATGFPFGIGPSVSAGVVAGLKREFDDPEDKEKPKMTNLIQFDAAVNPGNSGGPLVNRDGEVVGIVTAIYNPTGARVFAGMAFAVPIENAAKAVGENPL